METIRAEMQSNMNMLIGKFDEQGHNLVRLSNENEKLRRQLKKASMWFAVVVCILVGAFIASAFFAADAFRDAAATNTAQAEVLSRRSPTLEFLACSAEFDDQLDDYASRRDAASKDYIFKLVDNYVVNPDGTDPQVVIDARLEYEDATNDLRNLRTERRERCEPVVPPSGD